MVSVGMCTCCLFVFSDKFGVDLSSCFFDKTTLMYKLYLINQPYFLNFSNQLLQILNLAQSILRD